MNLRKTRGRGLWIGLVLLFSILLGSSAQAAMTSAGSKNVSAAEVKIYDVTGKTYAMKDFSGSVTALFFGRTGCGLTQNMVFRASEVAAANPGKLKVVLMDIDTPLDTCKAFAAANTSIMVAHDSGYWSQACSYLRACGISTSGLLYFPAAFLIDQNQKIQYASLNVQADLETNLNTMLKSWKQPEFKITYQLNGGKNNKANPAVYKTGKSITLKNPARAGYLFAGWYSNAKLTQKTAAISAKATGAKTFYAKWKKVTVAKGAITGISSKTAGKIAITMKKLSGVKGYHIVTATNAQFSKNVKRITVSGSKPTLSSMPKGKVVYVKLRGYAKDSTGKTIVGKYSTVKKITVKK